MEISLDRYLFFKKKFKWGIDKWSAAGCQYILTALNLAYNKNCIKL